MITALVPGHILFPHLLHLSSIALLSLSCSHIPRWACGKFLRLSEAGKFKQVLCLYAAGVFDTNRVHTSLNRSSREFTGLSDEVLEEFLGILHPHPSSRHTHRSDSSMASSGSSSCALSTRSSHTSTRSHPYCPSYHSHHIKWPSSSTGDVLNQSFIPLPCHPHCCYWKYLMIDSSIFNMKQYALNNEPSTSLSSNYHHPLGKLPFLLDQMTKFNYRTTNSTPSTL